MNRMRIGSLLLLAVLLLAWEAACRALAVPKLVLPPPSARLTGLNASSETS